MKIYSDNNKTYHFNYYYKNVEFAAVIVVTLNRSTYNKRRSVTSCLLVVVADSQNSFHFTPFEEDCEGPGTLTPVSQSALSQHYEQPSSACTPPQSPSPLPGDPKPNASPPALRCKTRLAPAAHRLHTFVVWADSMVNGECLDCLPVIAIRRELE